MQTWCTVQVKVFAQHMMKGVVTTSVVTEARLVYVAVNEQGKQNLSMACILIAIMKIRLILM